MTATLDDRQPTLTAIAAAVEAETDPLRRLEAILRLRTATTTLESATVRAARTRGASWTAVGACLGISKQAASKRFGVSRVVEGQAPTRPVDRRERSKRTGWEIGFPGRRALLHIRPRQEGDDGG